MSSSGFDDDGREPTCIDGPKAFTVSPAPSKIELQFVHVAAEDLSNSWRMLEFWTANTMYGLDSSLCCIDVDSRVPGTRIPEHLLGASLVGSQERDGNHFSISFPYPVPGMQAVFRLPDSGKHITTSSVERTILRVRMTNLDLAQGETPDWDHITTQWSPRENH